MVRHYKTRPIRRSAPRAMQAKSRSARAAAARLKLSKPMRVLVDRRVDRKLETKVAYYHNDQWQNFTPKIVGTVGASSFQQVLPPLPMAGQPGSEPADRENRIGSEVILTSLQIKGTIAMTYTDNSTWSCLLARLLVISAKGHNYWPEVSPVATLLATNLLRAGSVNQAFVDDLESYLMPLNFARVTTHHEKRINFSGPFAYGSMGGLDSKVVQFTINLKVRNKKLKYDSPTEVFPRNYAPFLCCGYTSATSHAVGGTPLYGEYRTRMAFKDA